MDTTEVLNIFAIFGSFPLSLLRFKINPCVKKWNWIFVDLDSNELLMTETADAQRGTKEDEMWAVGLDVLRERVISSV